MRDFDDAMLVAHNDVPHLDIKPAHIDGNAHIYQMHIGVGHQHIGCEGVKAEFAHLVQVAHAAVGDGSHAAERLVDVRLHFAPERADDIGIVNVFQHKHARLRNLEYGVHPVQAGHIHIGAGRHIRRYDGGNRVANHMPHIGEYGLDGGHHKALSARHHIESLDGVGDRAGRDLPQFFQLLRGEVRQWNISFVIDGWLA